ncbi:DUF1402 family protein [soil metagenome]
MPRLRLALAFLCWVGAFFAGPVHAQPAEAPRVAVVPPGNRSTTQPEISGSSIARTAETKGDFDTKFKRVYEQLSGDRQLIEKIKQVAALYGIDPVHMIGAIVGEHTYNVDVMDNLQGYYVKALAYLGSNPRFAFRNEDVTEFIKRPQFKDCDDGKSEYERWSCREAIWKSKFQGRIVDGTPFPDDRFQKVFFQPFFAGQTFGLGQLNPLTAMTVADMVSAVSRLPPLDLRDPSGIYKAVMDPDTSLHYMAAVIRNDIDTYRRVAGFDISKNPGITATLYNLGEASERARTLAAENRRRREQGLGPLLPKENYYGWLVNARLEELRKLL